VWRSGNSLKAHARKADTNRLYPTRKPAAVPPENPAAPPDFSNKDVADPLQIEDNVLHRAQPAAHRSSRWPISRGTKSTDTLRGYIRDAEIFKGHAGNGLL
jgi:hypothetical protein